MDSPVLNTETMEPKGADNITFLLTAAAIVAGCFLWMYTMGILVSPNKTKSPITLKPSKDTESPSTVDLKLIEKETLTHDTRRFRFALPSPDHILGLPVGQHISLRYRDAEGKLVMRSYTPTSSNDAKGYMELIVKIYFKNVHPKFPDGGKMSQHLESLRIGDKITVSGPKGKLTYVGKGEIHILHRPRDLKPEIRHAKKIGMIAGGTGITPMLQIIRQALKDPKDTTEFYLLLANQSEADILCRTEMDEMVAKHTNVKVWYTIDRVVNENTWKYSKGFVNAEMIKEHLPSAEEGTQIFMCGPPPMLKFAVLPALEELGYTPNMHFSF